MVTHTQHFIHNPEAFLEAKAYERQVSAAKAQVIAQLVSSASTTASSIFLHKRTDEETPEAGSNVRTSEAGVTPAPVEDAEPKDVVSNLIDNFDTLDETTQNALIERYNALIDKNGAGYDQDLIKLNLNNYLKGMDARKTELKFGLVEDDCSCKDVINIEGVQDALDNKDFPTCIEAYRTAAQQFIAQYDTDGDGKINLEELKAQGIDVVSPEDRAEFALAFLQTINRDNDATTLDTDEIAAYLLTMARINDYDANGRAEAQSAATIDLSEYATTQNIIFSNTKTHKEYARTIETQMKEILKNANIDFNTYMATEDLTSLSGLTEDDISILQEYKANRSMITQQEILESRLKTNYDGFIAN